MMGDSDQTPGFDGNLVVAFESRMANQMAKLISRHGGRPLVAPAMQEIPLENNTLALDFAKTLMSGNTDILIFLTGVGTKTLIEVWKTRFPLEPILQALKKTTLVARGPKSVAALKELGIQPDITVPEPNTWKDILRTLDAYRPKGLGGLQVAIQEYGKSNPELIKELTKRGAHVTSVPVYRWALPHNIEPLLEALKIILQGEASVVLFTSAAQADHIATLLQTQNELEPFRQALAHMMVASIGPITSQGLAHYHFPVDFEPSHSKMGILVKEASQKMKDILNRKTFRSGSTKREQIVEPH